MGVGRQRHSPAVLLPEKYPIPIVKEAEWGPGPAWTWAENLAHTAIRSPDRRARSHSLYRLRHPGPQIEDITIINIIANIMKNFLFFLN